VLVGPQGPLFPSIVSEKAYYFVIFMHFVAKKMYRDIFIIFK